MPTALNDTLLNDGASVNYRGSRRVVGVIFVGLLLSVGFVCLVMGQDTSGPGVDHDVVLAKLASPQKTGVNQTALDSAIDASCYTFTGDTCVFSECDASHNSQCVVGKCVCERGCTGIDSKCYDWTYRKANVRGPFTLTNQKFGRSWLYMKSVSLFQQLKVSAMPASTFKGSQYFDLYELPGNLQGKKQYLLASHRWPQWVAAIRPTGWMLTGSLSLWGLYAVDLVHTVAQWEPAHIVVQVCNKNSFGSGQQVMIGNAGVSGSVTWAYLHHGSWYVYGWTLTGDPGEGGYWNVADSFGNSVDLSGLDQC